MANTLHVAEKDNFTPVGKEMGKWMDQVLGSNFQHYGHADRWKPAINLCEHETHFCVIVDLAGIQASEIDLCAEEGVLVLTGERAMAAEPDTKGEMCLHLMEIDYGPFRREIQLPDGVNIDAIEAFYRNGYLWVHIPKAT